MLRANDLRIGNIVLYKPYGNRDGEPVIIAGMLGMKAYFNKHSNESGMFHNLEAIPLTPELLQKCGFEKRDHDDKVYTYDADNIRIPICLHWPGINGECSLTDVPHTQILSERFKYVHQLQNLFWCITGTELEVNL